MSTTNSNTEAAPVRATRPFWRRGPVLLACVPIALVTIAVAAMVGAEMSASARLNAELSRIRDSGAPVGDDSIREWFRERTSQAGTQDWAEILRLAEPRELVAGVDLGVLPYVGSGELPDEIPREGEWTEEPRVAEYLDQYRPVLERIHAATEHPTPVWQPIRFEGFMTGLSQLQESRSVSRLLQLDIEHAVYLGDQDRAIRSLASLGRVSDVFDWQICIVADLVRSSSAQSHHRMIRRLLSVPKWDDDHLVQIQEQLGGPLEVADRIRSVVEGERAMFLSAVRDPSQQLSDDRISRMQLWMLTLPSSRLGILNAYRDVSEIGTWGIGGMVGRGDELATDWEEKRSRPWEQGLLSPSLAYMYWMPSFHFASVLEREEDSRQFALTAVAIKRFDLKHGRWPDRLSELDEIGIRASDRRTVSGGPFGYEVADGSEAADDSAYLWSYSRHKEDAVAATRSAIDAEKGAIAEGVLIRIR